MALAPATVSDRRWKAAFWVSTLASAAPFLLTRHPPFADSPEHVAAIATLARLARGEGLPYVVDASHSRPSVGANESGAVKRQGRGRSNMWSDTGSVRASRGFTSRSKNAVTLVKAPGSTSVIITVLWL